MTSMKALICMIALTATALAEPPVKKSLGEYSPLWTNSFFTSKPPPQGPNEAESAFTDWSLGGVSPVDGGYMITLFNRKKPEMTMTITPKRAITNDGTTMETSEPGKGGTFSFVKVEQGKTSWKETKVTLMAGGKVGVLGFDTKSIIPKASAAPAGNRQGQPGQPQPAPGGVQVNVPPPSTPPQVTPVNGANPNNQNNRVPRPRVVPPTTR